MNVSYHATRLYRLSPEGLEAVELFPWDSANFPGQKPPHHQRRDVRVVTAAGTYRGGILTYPTDGKGSVYLCPDLISDQDKKKISLAKVLSEIGVKPGDTVNVKITGNTWSINR
ncbi:MAG TPA: hypothetical protein VGL82_22100 [Bryobacteraceae bacterium]|jgi:hypothetical protein